MPPLTTGLKAWISAQVQQVTHCTLWAPWREGLGVEAVPSWVGAFVLGGSKGRSLSILVTRSMGTCFHKRHLLVVTSSRLAQSSPTHLPLLCPL